MSGVTIDVDVFDRLNLTSENGNEEAEVIRRFTLENENGMSVQLINYGATVTSISVPDRNGIRRDVVLGFDSAREYRDHVCYFGATIGRFANRIARGVFSIGSDQYRLSKNENDNHLHGGFRGFDKRIWEASIRDERSVAFVHRSLSRHENYPGDMTVEVVYSLNDRDELEIEYRVTDITALTPINLTNHSYFNLSGHDSGSIRTHVLKIYSNHYLPVDDENIPTGETRSVGGTPFDFRSGMKLDQLESVAGGGYDLNLCLIEPKGRSKRLVKTVATVYEETSGIGVIVRTDQPGVQLYTANFLPTDQSLRGKGGARYRKHAAFCLETQNYPDAVNKESFPACLYGPGDTYRAFTGYRFTVDR